MKVGGRTVEKAAHILRDGSPELVEKVRSGKLSVDGADKLLPKKPIASTPVAPARHIPNAQHAKAISDLAAGFLVYEREQAKARQRAAGESFGKGGGNFPHAIEGTGKAAEKGASTPVPKTSTEREPRVLN